jgi:hypothetical protein
MTIHIEPVDTKDRPATRQRVIAGRMYRVRSGHGWGLSASPPVKPATVRRPARIAVMLSLAHRLRSDLEQGVYENGAAVASALGVTRARITQLFALTFLAPDIQEELLFLEAVDGVEPLSVRALYSLVRMSEWSRQREAWVHIRDKLAGGSVTAAGG